MVFCFHVGLSFWFSWPSHLFYVSGAKKNTAINSEPWCNLKKICRLRMVLLPPASQQTPNTPHRPSATSCRHRFWLMITESVKVWHHSPLYVVPSGRCHWQSPLATHPPLVWRRSSGSTTGQVRCWRKKWCLSPTVVLRLCEILMKLLWFSAVILNNANFYRLVLTMFSSLNESVFATCKVAELRPRLFSILLIFLGNISNFYYVNLSSVRNTEGKQSSQHRLHRGWLSVTV